MTLRYSYKITIANQKPKEWTIKTNRKGFFDKYAKAKGFDPLIAENWYLQTATGLVGLMVLLYKTFNM